MQSHPVESHNRRRCDLQGQVVVLTCYKTPTNTQATTEDLALIDLQKSVNPDFVLNLLILFACKHFVLQVIQQRFQVIVSIDRIPKIYRVESLAMAPIEKSYPIFSSIAISLVTFCAIF